MGGNAMKHVGVQRKGAAEYFRIAKEVEALAPKFSRRHAVIPAYRRKETFGDLDLLVVPPGQEADFADFHEAIQEAFKPTDIKRNSNVWSLDYRNLQLDIICTPPRLFDCALQYYSYNDAGSLIGRVAHGMGLKLGHKGLSLPVRVKDTQQIGVVELSVEPGEILQFLGYDPKGFEEGFESLEEIFAYVASSPYFDKNAFALENMDHKNRTRNRKRPTFCAFVQWLRRPKNAGLRSHNFAEDKEDWTRRALEHFAHNGAKEQLERILAAHEGRQKAREKFNGRIVQKLTGLEGEELGEFMAYLAKGWKTREDMERWAAETGQDQIEAAVKGAHKTWPPKGHKAPKGHKSHQTKEPSL
jgi:hypothetical protein